jgi:hypothetical protein
MRTKTYISISIVLLFALGASFLVPTSTRAAAALVSSQCAGGTQNTVTTAAIDTTGANLLVIAVTFDTTATQTISDSKGNTWNALTRTTNTSSGAVLYWSTPTSVGSSHTFSNTGTSNFSSICVMAFSGAAASTPFDQENGATNSSTTLQPGSITPSQNNEIVVTGFGFNQAGTPVSINSSFTQPTAAIEFSSGAHYGLGMAYIIQTTATAVNPTWTRTNTQTNAARIASFKSAAVAAATVKVPDIIVSSDD